MKKYHGIISTSDYCYVRATVAFKDGKLRLLGLKQWEQRSFWNGVLLGAKPIMLGLATHWVRPQGIEGFMDRYQTTTPDGPFVACCDKTFYSIHSNAFAANLQGACPDDAYLVTLPQALGGADKAASFLCLSLDETRYKAGVIIHGRLNAVFNGQLQSPDDSIPALLRRIERFWQREIDPHNFPRDLYVAGNTQQAFDNVGFDVRALDCSIAKTSIPVESALRAIGVALAHDSATLPRFCGPSPESRLRIGRALAYATSLFILVASLGLFAGLSGYNAVLSYRLDKAKTAYQSILRNTQKLRALATANDSLAGAIISLNQQSTHQTNWGRFLEFLSTSCPEEISFQQLASEPKGNGMRLALSGLAEKELAITEMTRALQNCPFVNNVTLASMEQNEPLKNNYRFIIQCDMQLRN